MLDRLWLIALIFTPALVGMPRMASAQDPGGQPQDRYIEELKQRNAAYGPGCNGVGISVPVTVEIPASMTSRWAGGHSACIPGLRLVIACAGDIIDADRIIGCTLQVAEGQLDRTIACEQFTLISPDARYTPDTTISDTMGLASEGGSQSCSQPRDLTPDTTVAAAFRVPAAESAGDLAITLDIDGSEVPAFLIPAGQLGIEAGSGS
jgi:hypothetical protein